MYNSIKNRSIKLQEKILNFLSKNKDVAYSEKELAEIFEESKLIIHLSIKELERQEKIKEIKIYS